MIALQIIAEQGPGELVAEQQASEEVAMRRLRRMVN